MKYILTILLISICLAANAQKETDIKTDISDLKREIWLLKTANTKLNSNYNTLLDKYTEQSNEIKLLSDKVTQNTNNISKTANELGVKIEQTDKTAKQQYSDLDNSLSKSTLYWIIAFLGSLLLLAGVFIFLRKRITKDKADTVEQIKNTKKTLEEEAVKLDGKLVEILETQLKINKEAPATDHSLALKVADEIVRIETNLSRMDESIKGYKQLAASVRRIKDNFMANGYEMVDMLGKPYHEGIIGKADFVSDENLKEGERIITNVIKPQINFGGIMIQKAHITVNQNI